jgi:hypothetical protein
MEDVAENWDAIHDATEYTVPRDLRSWSAAFLAHQPPNEG